MPATTPAITTAVAALLRLTSGLMTERLSTSKRPHRSSGSCSKEWNGGGEVTVRGNVASGDGMWKSTDAGKTWKSIGLKDSRHIPRIRVHPNNPDLVYTAVLGHISGPNDERGVYRSKDGGKTWEKVTNQSFYTVRKAENVLWFGSVKGMARLVL